jgi:hypothetical protein
MKLAELSKMTESQRNSALEDLVRAAQAPPNGQLSALEAEIRDFEIRYEMTSDEMRAGFRAGNVRDTADIAKWLMLVQVRDRARGQ